MEMSQSYHVSVTLMTTWQALQGIKARVRCVPVCVCVCVCVCARVLNEVQYKGTQMDWELDNFGSTSSSIL